MLIQIKDREDYNHFVDISSDLNCIVSVISDTAGSPASRKRDSLLVYRSSGNIELNIEPIDLIAKALLDIYEAGLEHDDVCSTLSLLARKLSK